MNKKQTAAFVNLCKALERCGREGLQGGIFDVYVCMWPTKSDRPSIEGNVYRQLSLVGGQASRPAGVMLEGAALDGDSEEVSQTEGYFNLITQAKGT